MQDTFLGEILGAVILGGDDSTMNSEFQVKPINVIASGVESEDGQMKIDEKNGRPTKILVNVDDMAYYDAFANQLGDEQQSAVVGSFEEQKNLEYAANIKFSSAEATYSLFSSPDCYSAV